MPTEMRKKDRQLSEEEAFEILKKAEYGTLSTMGEDGYPYGVALSHAVEGGKIYFHCAAANGHKNANMAFCGKVCFSVVGATQVVPGQFTTKYESAVAFGTARQLEGEEKEKAMQAIITKFCPEFIEEGFAKIGPVGPYMSLYEIAVEHITGKANR